MISFALDWHYIKGYEDRREFRAWKSGEKWKMDRQYMKFSGSSRLPHLSLGAYGRRQGLEQRQRGKTPGLPLYEEVASPLKRCCEFLCSQEARQRWDWWGEEWEISGARRRYVILFRV